MFNDDTSFTGSLLGTLFLSGMFYLTHQGGKETAKKEMQEEKQNEEIEDLKRQIREFKQRKI